MNEERLYSVKEVCEEFDITRKTLFYYDKAGLLKPSKRMGKQRFKYYNDEAVSRLRLIINYRSAGLIIEEIRTIIDIDDKQAILLILMDAKKRLTEEAFEKEQELKRLELLIDMISRSVLTSAKEGVCSYEE